MKNPRYLLRLAGLLGVLVLAIGGCSSPDGPSLSPSDSADAAWKSGLDASVVAALSELSDADRTAAIAQKTCPVTDMQLGSMGKPMKLNVEGKDVFLCCDACEPKIKAEP